MRAAEARELRQILCITETEARNLIGRYFTAQAAVAAYFEGAAASQQQDGPIDLEKGDAFPAADPGASRGGSSRGISSSSAHAQRQHLASAAAPSLWTKTDPDPIGSESTGMICLSAREHVPFSSSSRAAPPGVLAGKRPNPASGDSNDAKRICHARADGQSCHSWEDGAFLGGDIEMHHNRIKLTKGKAIVGALASDGSLEPGDWRRFVSSSAAATAAISFSCSSGGADCAAPEGICLAGTSPDGPFSQVVLSRPHRWR